MEITVTYRPTRRLSIRITKEGEVRVSAPYGVSKRRISAFVESHRDWIEKSRERILASAGCRRAFYDSLPQDTLSQRKEAARRLSLITEPLISHYSQLMGVTVDSVRYRANRSKWGSCNVEKKIITFSTYLLLLPSYCIEHVVVHELAHLLVPNHSREFYSVMDIYFPDWKKARKETRLLSSGQLKGEDKRSAGLL
ncbi:MAG: M48 family metallopeptidase [Bacteroidales bacterium]|nr:M48 family metallopeptidase [Bacteroidales bacterium]